MYVYRFLLGSLFLLFHRGDSTRSLPQSAIEELSGLYAKKNLLVLLASYKNETATNAFANAVSKACVNAVLNLGLNKSRELLFRYVDASGKLESGLAGGNIDWLGSYSVCQNISGAHYCLAPQVNWKISAGVSVPLKWGMCVPAACSETDIAVLFSLIVKVYLSNMDVSLGKDQIKCAHPSKWTTGPIITLVVCSIIACLCLIGTLIDLCMVQGSWKFWFYSDEFQGKRYLPSVERSQASNEWNNESSSLLHSNLHAARSDSSSYIRIGQPNMEERCRVFPPIQFLLSFSIIRNTSKVMDCTVPPGAITSLNGVRVLSMWWVILGHTYASLYGIVNDPLLGVNIIHRFTFEALNNAFFSVDSFFVLSGFLVAYLTFRRMDKNDGKLPLFKFYFHRFWRLTPSYMFVILFYANLYAFLGEGPLWFTNQSRTKCDKYWWTNLLYINNFYPKSLKDECLGWSWYLANDMQFYIISPLLLFIIYRFKWKGVVIGVGGLLQISLIVTGVIIGVYNTDSIIISGIKPEPNRGNYMDLVYIKPYCRIAPYLVGIALGYLIHIEKAAPRQSILNKIPRQIVCLVGWFVATGLGVTIVYSIYTVTKQGGKPLNKAENIVYGTLCRFVWGLALAWVIYACNKGYGSLVNKFLSASYWIPLSRLTYSAYLLHLMVLGAYFGSFQHTTEYTDRILAFYFVSVVVMSYAAAFVLAVCVELPMMQLESVLFFREKRSSV